MLQAGESASSIARSVGVSRPRIQYVKKRMLRGLQCNPVTGEGLQGSGLLLSKSMKQLTIRFTPAVYDALVEACTIANRQDPEEQITISDYVEQVTINNLVEMGLVRKHKRSK